MNTQVMFSSKEECWETPQWFFDKLNEEFHFTLDACATDDNAKCERYFTKEQNGLLQSWGGQTVWCNPPYGRVIGDWVQKAAQEAEKPGTTVVLLVPARTDTKWFHDYILHKAEVRFLRGRLKFGDSSNSAPFPNLVEIYGSRTGGMVDE